MYILRCFAVTVADYANADPAIVKSGRLKKAVANAIEKEGEEGVKRHSRCHGLSWSSEFIAPFSCAHLVTCRIDYLNVSALQE